jgi:hypothetical protein
MILKEGGNVFKDANGPLTQRIATKDVEATVKYIEQVTGLDFTKELGDDNKPKKWLGTTGRKEDPDGTFELNSSGDLDLSVDSNEISKQEFKAKMEQKFGDAKVAMKGDNVHVQMPIRGNEANGFVQADFMFSDNPKYQQGAMLGGTGQFKGMHRHIMMSSIARARGIKYSPKFGLVDPNKGDELITNDWDEIAKQLLDDPNAKEADLRSVETINAKIKGKPDYEDLVAKAKEAFSKENLTLETASLADKNHNRVVELAKRLSR